MRVGCYKISMNMARYLETHVGPCELSRACKNLEEHFQQSYCKDLLSMHYQKESEMSKIAEEKNRGNIENFLVLRSWFSSDARPSYTCPFEEARRQDWQQYSINCRPLNVRDQMILAKLQTIAPTPGIAVELGCGHSFFTRKLLERNWTVIAVDSSSSALQRLKESIQNAPLQAAQKQSLVPVCAKAEEYQFPKHVDFICAFDAFSYFPPKQFPLLWDRMHDSLNHGGHIAGDFFMRPIQQRQEESLRAFGGVWFAHRSLVEGLLQAKGYEQVHLQCEGFFKKEGGRIHCIGKKV